MLQNLEQRIAALLAVVFAACVIGVIILAAGYASPQWSAFSTLNWPFSPQVRSVLAASVAVLSITAAVLMNHRWGPFIRFRADRPQPVSRSAQHRFAAWRRSRIFALTLLALAVIIIAGRAWTERKAGTSESAINMSGSGWGVDHELAQVADQRLEVTLAIVSLAAFGIAAVVALGDVMLVRYRLHPLNRRLMSLPHDTPLTPIPFADLPPELAEVGQELVRGDYVLLGGGDIALRNGHVARRWLYRNRQGTVFALLASVAPTVLPAVTLTSVLFDGTVVETRYRTNIRIDEAGYVVDGHGDVDALFALHEAQLTRLLPEHGSPLIARSLEEHSDLVQPVTQAHTPTFERAVSWSWRGVPLIVFTLALGMFIATVLSFEPGTFNMLACLAPGLAVFAFITLAFIIVSTVFTTRNIRQLSQLVLE